MTSSARVCVHAYVDAKQCGLKYLELMEERQVVLMYKWCLHISWRQMTSQHILREKVLEEFRELKVMGE